MGPPLPTTAAATTTTTSITTSINHDVLPLPARQVTGLERAMFVQPREYRLSNGEPVELKDVYEEVCVCARAGAR